MIMEEKDWFKLKKYPHIGLPLENKHRSKWIESYITNPQNIATHSFLPFLHKVSKKRRYRKKYNDDGILVTQYTDNQLKNRFKDIKPRELYYASHLDSLIFSYYTKLLDKPYEKKLQQNNLDGVVTAYRRIPKDRYNAKSANKCNIDFANDIFRLIKNYPEEIFTVITLDIKSFFDNLDHKLLLQMIMKVLNVSKLEKDYFNVYKNITRFSYVDIQDLFKEYSKEVICQKNYKSNNDIKEIKKKVTRIKYLKNQGAKAFCLQKDFVKNKKHLIKSHRYIKKDNQLVLRNFGIPQGSPISSLLANIYLLEFDKGINDYVHSKGGYYKRYSDDMIVICKMSEAEKIEKLFYSEIQKYKLEIQPQKTQKFIFQQSTDSLSCGQQFKNNINPHKNLIYLGFEFDGKKVLLKSASLAGYYRKMKKNIRRAKYYSRTHNKKIFKRRLYKKFTFRGARKYNIYRWDSTEQKFKITKQQNWGNFLSYAKKSANIMDNNGIKKQIKNHWKIFHKELNK
ncbi:RNA-dependent DNA polymerase [Elizabethkingia anophelis]|nr:RNA-dependent DNA polymerase [Elizabethkingia anophelis]